MLYNLPFLSDYEGTQSIKVPNGYAFPSHPTLMQLYVAYKTKNLDYFGNFSGTGSAIEAIGLQLKLWKL
jgi:hypothetical protein